jgi:hypothetical protein
VLASEVVVHPSHHGFNINPFTRHGQWSNHLLERGERAGVKRRAVLLVRVDEADSSAR